MLTVMLVDDHPIVRRGVRALLKEQPDLQVIAEAGDGLAASHLVQMLRPDVLVLDLKIGAMSGIEVARLVTRSSPATSIVILSMHGNKAYVLEALKAGARAFVLKEAAAEQLVHAIREAVAHRLYLSPPLSKEDIEAYRKKVDNIDAEQLEAPAQEAS